MSIQDPAFHLSDAECWVLLEANSVARLAVDIAGHPDIFPINYIVDAGSLVFRSGPGTKLAGAVLNRHVAVEIDGLEPDDRSVWSVVLKGVAHEISDMEERFAADDLPLYPWVTSQKASFVRITPDVVSGRRFPVADHVDRPADDLEHHPGAPRLRPD